MDETLASYATPRQLEYLEAVEKYGSARKAAPHIGADHRDISASILRLKKKAALQGHSPAHDMTHTVPDGFKVKGVSTYYDEAGKPRGQWVKSSADDDRREQMLREFAQSLADGVKGLAPICLHPLPDGDPGVGSSDQDY